MNKSYIVYQIYPMSFNDSNNDGYGDLVGIIEKIPYLKWLGITHIWLSPIFESTFKDNGYDVIDYKKIDKRFGNMHNLEYLISEAKKYDIQVVMDMVFNHTSYKNKWFINSVKSIGKYKDYYIWRDKPSNMKSQFEDSSWTYYKERGQYVFHHFSKYQPDLNWDSPDVEKEIIEILNFWIKKGVGGFRFDVIDMIGKDIDKEKIIDIDKAYTRLKQIAKKTWLKRDMFTVGEAWSTSREQAVKHIDKKSGIFTTIFNNGYMFIGWEKSRWYSVPFSCEDLRKFKNNIFSMQEHYYNYVNPSLFVENHDFPRSISRWFNESNQYQEKSIVVANSLYGMRGVMFIYNGQEFGLPNPRFNSINNFNDPETQKFIKNHPKSAANFVKASFGSRDNARAMLPWTGRDEKSWNSNAKYASCIQPLVKQIHIKDNAVHFYKFIIELRKKYWRVFKNGLVNEIKGESCYKFAYTISYDGIEFIFISNWSNASVSNSFDTSDYNMLYNYKFGNVMGPYAVFIGKKEKKAI